ncbi:ROK family transcriptional regulator [Mycolicibacterium mengxianglii]|uniref:ROK family transcriptional regulator n=1 Tax=Mycolicibacterium mengxianglii TaxID=2736649 RepID=UPI0018EF0268|nr:ROK family transcriptional regulator [Mycolicibacterium mengxianglii]
MPQEQRSADQLRWFSAGQLLTLVRAEPGITRAAAAARLGIGSGGATDLVSRLRRAELLDERPAPVQGRGRPTTVLVPHPRGPMVLAAEVRAGDWRLATANLDGKPEVIDHGEHARKQLPKLLAELTSAIGAAYRRAPDRVGVLSVSVAGTVSDSRLLQFTTRGWRDVELAGLAGALPADAEVPLLIGNDATLAGLAEARTGAARGAGTALHLIVAVGLGGALVVDGVPVAGAHGAAGEYGHIPFGDPALVCPCGARACWDLTIDGRALARHLGEPEPADPVGYAHGLLHKRRTARAGQAFGQVATALGAGIGGLVNLHDPDVVTLGGLAVGLRAAAPEAFEQAYFDGLMSYRKATPPPVRDGIHGDDAPLHGAVLSGLDHLTTHGALAQWARTRVTA